MLYTYICVCICILVDGDGDGGIGEVLGGGVGPCVSHHVGREIISESLSG